MSNSADPLAAPPAFAVSEPLASGRVLVRDLSVDAAEARRVAAALEEAFARHDGLAAAVARRIGADGVAAHGAFVLHPKGLVRNGRGAPRDGERFDAEVDAADFGVVVLGRDAFAAARGEAILDPRTGYGALAVLATTLELRRPMR